MESQDSFSRLKKRVKGRLSGSKPGPDRIESGAHSERVKPTNVGPQSRSDVRVRGDNGKANPGLRKPESGMQTILTYFAVSNNHRNQEDSFIDPDSILVPQDKTEQSAAGDNKSHWKSNVSAAAKLLLCMVRDSADAFPPLKSIAGGLCFILENHEVRFGPYTSLEPRCLESLQRAQGNRQAIESLAPRVKSLAAILCGPVSEDNAAEELRRKRLEQ
jgi:hypothetical protein